MKSGEGFLYGLYREGVRLVGTRSADSKSSITHTRQTNTHGQTERGRERDIQRGRQRDKQAEKAGQILLLSRGSDGLRCVAFGYINYFR